MMTTAVVLEQPERLVLSRIPLAEPGKGELVVDVAWSGISTGTERLLWTGRMPPFPGLGYPLVPGYEAVGKVSAAGPDCSLPAGTPVFVPGAKCFGSIRGLFGGAASRLVVPESRAIALDDGLGERGVLMALAATALHALAAPGASAPDLIVGHGVLGRLLARLAIARGAPPPVVWETNPARASGAMGYEVVDPSADSRKDYRSIYDVSGDAGLLDRLIASSAPGGEIVLAGFYSDRLSFSFPPAFMRETRLRVAAEWREADLHAVRELVLGSAVSLDGLITHRRAAADAPEAYRVAFEDPSCLKMVIDWSAVS